MSVYALGGGRATALHGYGAAVGGIAGWKKTEKGGSSVELRQVDRAAVAPMREQKLLSYHVPLLPDFHVHLAHHAEAWEIWDAESAVGYVLALRDPQGDHEHVTLIELFLTSPYRDSYEDAVAVVREKLEPRAYLVRSDDCTYETALLASGYQMEVSMAMMAARFVMRPREEHGLSLTPLDYPHLRAAHDVYLHVRGVQQAPTYSDLEARIDDDSLWVLTDHDQPIGLVVREPSEGDRYCLLDVIAPHAREEAQLWGLLTAGLGAESEGRTPAAVLDMRDMNKIRLYRSAGYYTAATYLVFYDAIAGRPSVPSIGRDELWEMIQGGESFHLIDVLGKDHWAAGHLPGAEWVDFKSLAKDVGRYEKDEKIVVYCNDYT